MKLHELEKNIGAKQRRKIKKQGKKENYSSKL